MLSGSLPKRSALPTAVALDLIEWKGKKVKVIEGCAYKWETIAIHLHFTPPVINAIKRNAHYQVEPACRAMFNKWLEGASGLLEPRIWATVVTVLKNADLGMLAEELDSVLSD